VSNYQSAVGEGRRDGRSAVKKATAKAEKKGGGRPIQARTVATFFDNPGPEAEPGLRRIIASDDRRKKGVAHYRRKKAGEAQAEWVS